MIWVLATDSTHCGIYSYQKKPAELKLIKEILHPELRLKKSKFLTSERPGHYQTKGTARGSFESRSDPKEVEVDKFARNIAEILDHDRKKQLYEKLVIIAPPHINGLLMQHLDKNVANLITHNIKKDYLHKNNRELLNYLNENLHGITTI